MKFKSWFALATVAKSTPIDTIIAAMADLPMRPHLKFIRVLYEKIKGRGLSKTNIYDLMSIIRDHLATRNIKAIEYDLSKPNHWTESRNELIKRWKYVSAAQLISKEKHFINLLLKNIKVETALKDETASLLYIWGHLGADDQLAELKQNYPLPLKSKTTLVNYIHANLIAYGLKGDVKNMELAYNYYSLSRLPKMNELQLNYCKFLILNNRNNMIPVIINSKKYSNDDLYHNLFLPLFANCPTTIFLHHFEKINSHIKKSLLKDVRIRLLIFKSYILEKKFKEIKHLIRATDPLILNSHPDILEGMYLGIKSVLEKRKDFTNQEEKMHAFKSIPPVQPKDILEIYPMMDVCYADLEQELCKIESNDSNNQKDVSFRNHRRLLNAYTDWIETFKSSKTNAFVPTRKDFLLIINALMDASLSVEEVENALIGIVDVMSHFKMDPIPDETHIEISRFFNAAKYIPSRWKIKLLKLTSNNDVSNKNTSGGKEEVLKATNISHFRFLVTARKIKDANRLAVELMKQGYNFARCQDYFIMLVNLNISSKNFIGLRLLFREYLKKLGKLSQDDSFYATTLFSMVQRKLHVETAELIEDMAATTGTLPEQGIINDLIFHISKLPQISHEQLQGALCVFSFLAPEKLTRELIEEMVYIAFAANKDLDSASHVFNLALERNIKLGNWCYQQLLHIFAAHERKDRMLQVVEAYISDGGTIMPINIAFEYFLALKDLEGMKKVLRLVRKSSLELDALSYKWILQGFSFMDSNMKIAESLWKSIKDNAFSYSDTPYKIMILGYSRMRTAEADEKIVDMIMDWMRKIQNSKIKLKVIESIVSYMVEEGFVDCADYFLETMRLNLKDAEMEYMLLKGYLETRNVPMVLRSFNRLLECVENQYAVCEKMAIYESLIDGLHKIGQSELADKYQKQALSQNAQ